MTSRYAQVAFTPSVRRHQRERGSDRAYRRMLEGPQSVDRLGPNEQLFISQRDSFYLATVSETGWPYLQHRGGPPGFLHVLDEGTLGFADFRGNRQYISLGNLDHDSRVALFLMDYANRTRLKILGRASAREADDDTELIERVTVASYAATVERAVLITVEAFDWNCSQHIEPRYTAAQVQQVITPLRERIAELERDNAALNDATA